MPDADSYFRRNLPLTTMQGTCEYKPSIDNSGRKAWSSFPDACNCPGENKLNSVTSAHFIRLATQESNTFLMRGSRGETQPTGNVVWTCTHKHFSKRSPSHNPEVNWVPTQLSGTGAPVRNILGHLDHPLTLHWVLLLGRRRDNPSPGRTAPRLCSTGSHTSASLGFWSSHGSSL